MATVAKLAKQAEEEKRQFKQPLIWIDCEMTGLDLSCNSIIEIAVIVTDGADLDFRLNGPEIVIHCSDEELDAMGDWCTRTHRESGLTAKVKASKVTLQEAERIILAFLINEAKLRPG